jgi:formiminotetrahydrofolate cyclodeaminase
VAINLSGADDSRFAAQMTEESERVAREATRTRERVLAIVRKRL